MTFLCGWMLWMCLLCVACALVLLVGMAQLRHVLSLTAPWLLRTDAHPLRVALFNPFHRKTTARALGLLAFWTLLRLVLLLAPPCWCFRMYCAVSVFAPREYGTSGRCLAVNRNALPSLPLF